jgi:hypothetical protein
MKPRSRLTEVSRLACAAGLLLSACTARSQEAPDRAGRALKNRWFFACGYGCTREGVEALKALVDTGAAHGLNGMVLSSFSLDTVTRWKETEVALLRELAAHCEAKRVELIPCGFSVGYGGGALGHDRSFAAALPVTLALTARSGKLVPAPGANLLANGDLEAHDGDRFARFAFHDEPGKVSFADPQAASGKASIRFEGFGASPHGHGRIMQKVAVRPGRAYRLTFKIRTRDLVPTSGLKAMVLAKGRSLAEAQPGVQATQEWCERSLDFINSDEKEVSVYAGIWEGRSGAFWLDDVRFFECGDLADIARRVGTPLTLRSAEREAVFAEGKDFGAIPCKGWLEPVPLPPGSAIRDGERLELSCYKIPYVGHPWGRQISLCMSNPQLYAYWEAQARRLREVIAFKRFLLSMDEIRNGGGCLSCRSRGLSMAQILGDCVTRQRDLLKRVDPAMEILIWSDMLDPAHNAHAQYYGVVGSFEGSWQHVPKDLTILCWHHAIRELSLGFFSKQGFRTAGAAYYDADDLAGSREWLASLLNTPGAEGILYTTWEKKYGLLAEFGDLVSAPHAR